jgi:hypothetical protein
MSTREETMQNHPAGSALYGMSVVEREQPKDTRSPFQKFFDSLEELEMTVEMHGTASVEADLARAQVRLCREGAAQAWRAQSVSAA